MAVANAVYSQLLSVAAIIAAMLAVVVYQRREATPSAASLVIFMLALTWWDFTYALHWSNAPRPTPWFWLDATFIGVVLAPTAYFVFALQYTTQGQWLTRQRLFLLSLMPLLTLLILWTDPWHGFFFGGERDMTTATILQGGPWFWMSLVYLYTLNLLSVLILGRAFWGASGLYRHQVGLVLLGGLLPWVGNFLSLLALNPLPDIDLTPLAFTLTGVVFAYSLLYYRLLDIVPVARDLLVEHMLDAVLVLDSRRRVVDVNLAARTMLNLGPNVVGQPIGEVLANVPELAAQSLYAVAGGSTFVVQHEPYRIFDLRVVALPSYGQRFTGTLIVIRDVTSRVRAEDDLRNANVQLHAQLLEIERLQQELREQAIRDSLTGVFNRRYFEETLRRELIRAQRDATPLAVILLDIDHFKQVNDRYGHPAGDLVIQEIGQLLQQQTRGSDIVCRYGGEEFAVVLPNATVEQAAVRVDEWRKRIAGLSVSYEHATIRVTVSAGVAAFPTHGATRDDIMQAADEALYASKRMGRNRMTIALVHEFDPQPTQP